MSLLVLLALAVPVTAGADVFPVGSEFQVNTYTSGSQLAPAICHSTNGDFVTVWEDNPFASSSGPGYGAISAQRFASSGAMLGTEFEVSTGGTVVFSPDIACQDGDGFVVVWAQAGGPYPNTEVFARRFGSDGSPAGTEFQVNTYTSGAQGFAGVFPPLALILGGPSVSADTNGDFVVVWESQNLFSDPPVGDHRGIFGQRFDSMGTAQGTEFQVNSYTSTGTLNPDVAVDGGGDFVVVWTSTAQDGDDTGVFGQRFASSGAAQGTEFQVNTYTVGFQSLTFFFSGGGPAVSSDTAGGFVVVWDNAPGYGYTSTIAGQRFDPGGSRLGTEFEVASYTSQYDLQPDVARSNGGDFVVVWGRASFVSLPPAVEAFGRYYNSDGSPMGTEFQVNTYTTGDQGFRSIFGGNGSAVATAPGGRFTVVWDSAASYVAGMGPVAAPAGSQPRGITIPGDTPGTQDGSGFGVFGQQFSIYSPTVTPTATPTATPTVTPTTLPLITSGAEPGSKRVCGTAAPDLPGTCLEVCEVGLDNQPGTPDDDCTLGTGGTDASGMFCIDLTRPLVQGDRIFVKDTCNGTSGSVSNVFGAAPAPALSGAAIAIALAMLGLIGVVSLRRRWS